MANVVTVDFSNVKESSGINPVHQEEGDYVGRIVKADLTKSKAGDPQIVIVIQDTARRSATYPYYCGLTENQLWKLRNVLIAAGLPVPKSKGKVNIDRLVNKEVGITLEDDEYNGKLKSVIAAVMPKDDVESDVEAEADDFDEEIIEDEVEEVEEVEEAPKRKAKAKPAPVEEVEEEELDLEEEEEEDEEPAPAPAPKARRKAAAPAPVDEDEDEDDDLDLD